MQANTVLLISWILADIAAEPYYVIIVPRILRSNTDLHLAISVFNVEKPVEILAEILQNEDAHVTISRQRTSLSSNVTQILRFQIGELKPSLYRLSVVGSGGMHFHNFTNLSFFPKSHLALVQTDKTVYTEKDTIRFRVAVVNYKLRPTVIGSDGKSNIVKRWSRVFTSKGVIERTLKLSRRPVFGEWNLTVQFLDQISVTSFTVGEFIVPKFEILVDHKPYVTFQNSSTLLKITARYFHGRSVQGEAIVEITPLYKSERLQPIFVEPLRRVVHIDGVIFLAFNLAKELDIQDDNERKLKISIRVEEFLSKRRENVTVSMKMVKYDYNIQLLHTSPKFKPGLKYSIFLKITYPDGTPVDDHSKQVIVKHGFSNSSIFQESSNHWIEENGIVPLHFYPLPGVASMLKIQVIYRDVVENFKLIPGAYSSQNMYIQAELKTPNPKVNEEVIIEVNSTQGMDYFVYKIFGRGDLVFAQTVKAMGAKSKEFRFFCTPTMAPKAKLLVFYISEFGEMVMDSLHIEIDGTFLNTAEIRTSKRTVEAGQNVEISVEAKQDSYVALLATDKKSIMLKDENEISEKTVLKALKEEDFYVPPSSFYSSEVMKGINAVILSNAIISDQFAATEAQFRPTRPPLAGPYAFSRIPRPVDSNPRFYVPRVLYPTWIFSNGTAGPSNKKSFSFEVPSNITSWRISAFSNHPTYGLGVSQKDFEIHVINNLRMEINLPHKIYLGEFINVELGIFNDFNRQMTVHIVFKYSEEIRMRIDIENGSLERSIFLQGNEIEILPFLIQPLKAGQATIQVEGKSVFGSSSLKRILLVQFEGDMIENSTSVWLDLDERGGFYETNFTGLYPKNIVPNSVYLTVAATGDVMAPILANIGQLSDNELSSGENNIVNFLPYVYVMEYLKKKNLLNRRLVHEITDVMSEAYQMQMNFKRSDGSFSTFGSRDSGGSVLLTALTALSFHKAESFLKIEDNIVNDALEWLISRQAAVGKFIEYGPKTVQYLQQGEKDIPITCKVLHTLLSLQDIHSYNSSILSAINFVARQSLSLTDLYSIAISSFILHRVGHPSANRLLEQLETFVNSKAKDLPWASWSSASSREIEINSYILMVYLEKGYKEQAIRLFKWLISQRNSKGIFSTAMATITAMEALVKIAIDLPSPEAEITFKYGNDLKKSVFLSKRSPLLYQHYKLPYGINEITVTARGNGKMLYTAITYYNLNVTGAYPSFTLDPQVDKNADQYYLQMSVCTSYKKEKQSNMAVMDVSLPSGLIADREIIHSIDRKYWEDIKLVETKTGETGFIIYFEKLNGTEICATISGYRTQLVANQKPAAVKIYDYYDNSHQARIFYQSYTASLCDLCHKTCRLTQCARSRQLKQSLTNSKSPFVPSYAKIILIFILVNTLM